MTASLARIEANRLNAQKSTGPKTEEGRAASRRNALKHGLTGDGVVLTDPIDAQFEQYFEEVGRLYPAGDGEPSEGALVEQAALALARISQLRQVERDEREVAADRAASCWDLDRAAEAEALGARLSRDPSRLVAELRRSSPGCSWLIARWEGLAEAARRLGPWDDARRRLAADLLGLPPELRDADPRLDPDLPAEAMARLADAQLESLRALKAEVLDGLEAADRLLAATGRSFTSSPAGRRLRRYESGLFRRLTWSVSQLNRHRPRVEGRPASPPPPFPVPERPVRPRRLPVPSPSGPSSPSTTAAASASGMASAPSPATASDRRPIPSVSPTPAPAPPTPIAPGPPADRPTPRPPIDPRIARALADSPNDRPRTSTETDAPAVVPPGPSRSPDDRRSPAPPSNRRTRRAAAALARKGR